MPDFKEKLMIVFGSENKEAGKNSPFLISFEEGEDNEIRLVVALASKGKRKFDTDDIDVPGLREILKDSTPLCPSDEKRYEIIFSEYIMHQTRDESFCCWDDYEIWHGNFFIIFEKSRLLDYMDNAINKAIAESYWPEGWKHYGICCQNHIIDVISPSEPQIKVIKKKKFVCFSHFDGDII